MFCVEPAYLRNMANELRSTRSRLSREHAMLEETIARLNPIQMKGMDAVRRSLRAREADLNSRERELAALAQGLERISEYYSRTEEKNAELFENNPPVFHIWERIDLRNVVTMIPDPSLLYGTSS